MKNPIYWFLILLFVIIVLSEAVIALSKLLKTSFEIIALLVVVLFAVMNRVIPIKVFSLELLYFYSFFFFGGMLVKKYYERISLFFSHRYVRWFLGIALLFSSYFYRIDGSYIFATFMPQALYFIITGIVGTLFFMSIFSSHIDEFNRYLSALGKSTLGIYLIQGILFHSVLSFKLCLNTGNSLLFCFIGGAAISVISYLVNYILEHNKVTSCLVGK